jgi:hypothetical protein
MSALTPIIAIGGSIVATTWLINKYILSVESTKPVTLSKYILYLDFDGTITNIPGQAVDSGYDLFMKGYFSGTKGLSDSQITKLFGDERYLKMLIKFMQVLSSMSTNEVEIVIVTNNFESVVREVWQRYLKCDWSRINSNSGFRDRGLVDGKINFIKRDLMRNHTVVKNERIMFLDDDPINFLGQDITKNIKVIDCSGGRWIGKRLETLGYTDPEKIDMKVVRSVLDSLYSE